MHAEEPSLLTHVQDLRSRSLPEGGLSTAIFCGKMRAESDSGVVLDAHRSIVEAEVNKEGVNVTGLLMGQGNAVLHLIEGPSYSVLRILERLSQHDHFKDGTQVGRIVYTVEDRPQRIFPEWYSCLIAEKRSPSDDFNAESSKEVVLDLASGLLEVGRGLQAVSSADVEISRYADQLPGKNLILALSVSSLFFTLDEFCKAFVDPYHVDVDSEAVWPLERHVVY
jgi:hypothetical protein